MDLIQDSNAVTPINPFIIGDGKGGRIWARVDNWYPTSADEYVFSSIKGAIILPISKYINVADNRIDYFVLSSKRCYDNMKEHIVHYLNYFEKWYDPDRELASIYYHIKYFIDVEPLYTKESFIEDIKRYILSGSIYNKVCAMNEDNYQLELSYRNNRNPSLQYTEKHAAIMMKMSVLMNMVIPLLTHFIHAKNISNANPFLIEVFDIILKLNDGVDIYSKLYETASTNVNKSVNDHGKLWEMQDMRGINPNTHSMSCVYNIILSIMPKYRYDQNIIHFNYKSIINNTKFQVIDISYEYTFVTLSSSKRDEDNNSEFDKFESYLTKQDEALYLQMKIISEKTMENIENQFLLGVTDDEIEFYMRELSKDGRPTINDFQKRLIFNLFYKYFGEPTAIKGISITDYVKLMIAARKILEIHDMKILPYIISSRANVTTRKNINKKELVKLEASPIYKDIIDKYKGDSSSLQEIISIISTIISSEFFIIDYDNEDLNGTKIDILSDYLIAEVLSYITLI